MVFQKGNKAAVGKGRPPGSGQRGAMEAALKRYGETKFWDETFKMAKTDSTIRIALLRKLVPDKTEHSGEDGGPVQVKVLYGD